MKKTVDWKAFLFRTLKCSNQKTSTIIQLGRSCVKEGNVQTKLLTATQTRWIWYSNPSFTGKIPSPFGALNIMSNLSEHVKTRKWPTKFQKPLYNDENWFLRTKIWHQKKTYYDLKLSTCNDKNIMNQPIWLTFSSLYIYFFAGTSGHRQRPRRPSVASCTSWRSTGWSIVWIATIRLFDVGRDMITSAFFKEVRKLVLIGQKIVGDDVGFTNCCFQFDSWFVCFSDDQAVGTVVKNKKESFRHQKTRCRPVETQHITTNNGEGSRSSICWEMFFRVHLACLAWNSTAEYESKLEWYLNIYEIAKTRCSYIYVDKFW